MKLTYDSCSPLSRAQDGGAPGAELGSRNQSLLAPHGVVCKMAENENREISHEDTASTGYFIISSSS